MFLLCPVLVELKNQGTNASGPSKISDLKLALRVQSDCRCYRVGRNSTTALACSKLPPLVLIALISMYLHL